MYLNRSGILLVGMLLLCGCSSGFLGLAPIGDRQEYVQARALYEQGRYQEAITELSEYIYKTKNVKRREARAYRLLGNSYEQLGLLNRALEVYSEALEFHPDNVPLLLASARLYQQNGLTQRSVAMYERALQEDPDNTTALSGQAVNYATLGFYSRAVTLYNRFFELATQTTPLDRARYAAMFFHQRQYESAFIHITLALEQEPTQPDFWLLSAKIRRGLHQPQAALADLEAALSLAPQRTDLLAYKALWLYEAGQYENSLRAVTAWQKLQPDNLLTVFVQALNEHKQGKTKAARKEFSQIAEKSPDSFVGKVAKQLLTP